MRWTQQHKDICGGDQRKGRERTQQKPAVGCHLVRVHCKACECVRMRTEITKRVAKRGRQLPQPSLPSSGFSSHKGEMKSVSKIREKHAWNGDMNYRTISMDLSIRIRINQSVLNKYDLAWEVLY